MIHKITYVISDQYDPYLNLALEEFLLNTVEKETCILYLWQNEHTVVIGKNQNPWKECKIKELEEDGGYLVRRLSGGGAVFHDRGNLNFTFLLNKEDYDVEKQLEVILVALDQLGIKAEKSGRNDITIEGKKICGNAFYSNAEHCYHHGTLLVNVDIKNLSKYLNVSKEKLVSKGVDSVKSRVTNIINYKEDLSIDRMKDSLIEAFSKVYNIKAKRMDKLEYSCNEKDCYDTEIKRLYQKFSSWEWRFGKKIEFQHCLSKRFEWGDIDLHFVVNGGEIIECSAFSDAIEIDLIEQLPECLKGCIYSRVNMSEALDRLKIGKEENVIKMIEDIKELLQNEIE